jgi:hypothetical protein
LWNDKGEHVQGWKAFWGEAKMVLGPETSRKGLAQLSNGTVPGGWKALQMPWRSETACVPE